MYLFYYADGTFRQVQDNITVIDTIAIYNGVLRVFCAVDNEFYEVIANEDRRLERKRVPNSQLLKDGNGRLHHT